MKYRNDIQILRGYSIITIVLYHCNIFQHGYISVIIFIIISGYLLNTNTSVVRFCKRYLRLIFPCITNICIIIINYNDFIYEEEYFTLYSEILSTLFLHSNYYYIYYATDYFNPPDNSPLLHHWYISVDMQLFLFTTFNYFKSKLLNIIFSIISFLVYLITFQEYKSYNYFSFIPRVWEYLFPKIFIFHNFNWKIKYLSLITLSSILFYSNRVMDERLYQVIIVFFANFYLHISLNISFFLFEKIGIFSYYIYLVHYPVIKFESFNFSFIIMTLLYSILLYIIYGQNPVIRIFKYKYIYLFLFIIEMHILLYFNMKIIKNQQKININMIKNIDRKNYCCYKNKRIYNEKAVLIAGDSHVFNLLGNFYNILKSNNYVIYYKYIHTEFIVRNISHLYDISDYFHLIINMNLFYDNEHDEYLKYYTKRIIIYLDYLKSKSKIVIYIKPTPVLKMKMSCKYQKNHIAKNGVDILLYSNNIKYKQGITVFDIAHLFCHNITCYLNYKGSCIYSDEHHFTLNFYKMIFNYTIEIIKPYINIKSNINTDIRKCEYILYKNKILRSWKYPYRGCNLHLYF